MSSTALAAQKAPPLADRAPPHLFFLVSAIFHYLGPSFAVLLFAAIAPLGVAWLRIASAAVIFALWRRPWRAFFGLSSRDRAIVVALGLVLAAMNAIFYEAIARLPLGTVGAIEFLGPIAIAAYGSRSPRNLAALGLATAGVYALADLRIAGEPLGFLFAFANCALFAFYIVLSHRIASSAGGLSSVDRLGAAMGVAAAAALPIGFRDAMPAFTSLPLLLAAVGVGVSSSVIPYICDQLAMRRLPRATFALLLSLLPATASIIGFLVLRQTPSLPEMAGIALVVGGVALRKDDKAE
ncbi:MAG TPA: EamA family transporter [Roseiarcus sp.]|nr:EamA family transporter [Roseiarcus sp.]